MMKKKAYLLCSLLVSVCFVFGTAQAQQQQPTPPQQQQEQVNFSDEEIKAFIQVNEKVVEVQKNGEQEMMSAIEGEDIAVDRFNELLMAQQDPNQKTDASPEEMEAFGKASEKVMEVQKKLEEEAMKTIEAEGMDIEKYQQIMMAYQQNPQVQEQVQKLMGEQEGSNN